MNLIFRFRTLCSEIRIKIFSLKILIKSSIAEAKKKKSLPIYGEG